MSAIFIIFLLLIVATSLAVYFSKRLLLDRSRTKYSLSTPPPVSLFGESAGRLLPVINDEQERREKRDAEILARAAKGDAQVLREAHAAQDRTLYNAALDLLVAHSANDREALRTLAAEINVSNDLRANSRLAEVLLEDWKAAPDRNSMAEMLHVAALADDATVYSKAVEVALQFWGRANNSERTKKFCELVESQFWTMDAQARASGAGFVLKERLAEIRRELAAR